MVTGFSAMLVGQALAQTPPVQGILVTPQLSISERYTSNATQNSANPRSDFITQISPGIRVLANTARLKGSLDYRLNGQYYANNTSGDNFQNALTTHWVLEAIDNWAFVDFSGSISQQTISAFGTRTVDSFTDNSNSTEVSTFRLSPYVRGALLGSANYEARLNFLSSQSGAGAASDIRTHGGSLRLSGISRGPLGWGLDGTMDRTSYSLGRKFQNDQLIGRLSYVFNPQVNGYLSFGQERNNFTSVNTETNSVSGFGVNWVPSLRTKLAANVERHAYGRSYGLSFEHRTPRTAWRVSDTQGVSKPGAQSGVAAVGTLAGLLDSQFTALEPDPVRRAQLISNYLLANGYNLNTLVLGNFLASSASLQRRQEISFSLLGLRDTINFALSRGSNRRLSNLTTAFDDLSSVENVQQTGFVVSYSHRLTPDASWNAAFSRQNTASSGNVAGTSLRAFDVILSSRLGRQTFGSLGARRVFFDSTSPYTETSLTGSLSLQF